MMRDRSQITNTLWGLLVAPAPIFLLVSLLLVRPSLGWSDAMHSAGMALACSYGFMLAAGLPAHLLLRWIHWQTWTHYFWGFCLALALAVGVMTALEGYPSLPLANDNSPFAALTLRGGGWMFLFLVCLPLVAVMASMFWSRAVKVNTPAA